MRYKSIAALIARFASVSIVALGVAAPIIAAAGPELVMSVASPTDESVIVETITYAPTTSVAFAIAMVASSALALLVLSGARWPSVVIGAIATLAWAIAIGTSRLEPDRWQAPGGAISWCWLILTLLVTVSGIIGSSRRRLRDSLVGVVLGLTVAQSFGYFENYNPTIIIASIPGGLVGAALLVLAAIVVARSATKSDTLIALMPIAIVWTIVVTDRGMPPGLVPIIDSLGFAALLGVLVVLAVAGMGWALGSRRRRPMTS